MKFSGTSLAPRTISSALILSFALALPLLPTFAAADDQLPANLVDGLHQVFGKNHARAVHAKGIILEGSFTPTSEAKGLSKAPHFGGAAVPVTVRFSDFTGIPDIPDNTADASPRGLALKFKLPDGSDSDIVSHSFNGFPVATAEEFVTLLRAIAASGPKAEKPTALDKYFGDHPIAKTFLTTQKPGPVSFATLPYFGVNSFAFIDAKNALTTVRYRFVPRAGEQILSEADAKAKGPNYLTPEINERVAKASVAFDWFAQIAEPGDAIANPSIAWPETRKLVKLGTITVNRVASDQAALDKATIFLPGNVPAGIEAADPMIEHRTAAYPISFGERQ
jgi:catalase